MKALPSSSRSKIEIRAGPSSAPPICGGGVKALASSSSSNILNWAGPSSRLSRMLGVAGLSPILSPGMPAAIEATPPGFVALALSPVGATTSDTALVNALLRLSTGRAKLCGGASAAGAVPVAPVAAARSGRPVAEDKSTITAGLVPPLPTARPRP